MNSFYHFRQAIESGQKNTAMLIIRDKTESVARKIIEKAKVSVPDFRGRLFWQWVQNYIISACRANEGENYDRPCNTRDHVCSKPAATVQPQSGSHRYDQAHCSDSDADRPLQYCADARSQTGFYPLGRAAFPLFTLIWAMNVLRAPEKLSHRARRLWIWALVTQPVFMLTFYGHVPWYALNILFVFAGVTQLLAFWYRSGISGALAGTVLLVCMIWPLTPASFGVQGLVLALALVLVFSARSYAALLGGGCLVLVSLALLNGLPELGNNTANALKFAVLPTLVLPAAAV